MTYDILATGSSGNAVVINGEILIDCGVPYKTLEKSGYIKNLRLVLLTHQHSDHFNSSTVRRLHRERPTLRWICGKWMVQPNEKLEPGPLIKAGVGMRLIFPQETGATWLYGDVSVTLEEIPHDVPNCCWHIIAKGEQLFYATDTSTLDHIEAKDYNLYLIEANHTRAEIEARIAEKQARGKFAYEYRAAQNHLSREQALEWLARNISSERWNQTEIVFLHQHKEKEKKRND